MLNNQLKLKLATIGPNRETSQSLTLNREGLFVVGLYRVEGKT